MELNTYSEIIEFPGRQVTDHLTKENNDRILFSGKYGIGKISSSAQVCRLALCLSVPAPL